ncbi:MAG: DUF2975 domain-containing protein [Bacteroidota bacterium]
MKTKLTLSRLINIVLAVFILISISIIPYMFLMHSGTFSSSDSYSSSYDMVRLPSLDPEISDTLPYRKYVQLRDSIKNARDLKNGRHATGTSLLGIVGHTSLMRCDTCSLRNSFGQRGAKKEYFISFRDWKLDTTRSEGFIPVIYFVKDGQAYLRKTLCEKDNRKQSKKYTGTNYICKEKDIALPFRVDSGTKSMLIPVNKLTYDIAVPGLFAIYLLFFIYFVYFVIGGFVKFLAEIAQGTPFSEKNVKRLRFITLNLILLPLGLFLINLVVIPLVFHSYFTPDVKLDADSWNGLWKPGVLCIIFAALYVAFKKGKQLKEDNDLTV